MDNIKQEDIEDICFNVSKYVILPKFKNLSDDEINYKNGSDLVTAADIEAEKELKKNLLKILPFSNVTICPSLFIKPTALVKVFLVASV